MQVHIDDLPRLIFLDNPQGNRISLQYGQLSSTKDLFFFFFDLFCKGMVALYSTDGGTSVDLTSLSAEQLQHIVGRMALAGIRTTIETSPDTEEASFERRFQHQARINMPQLAALPDDAPLEAFVLRLCMQGTAYRVTFRLEHEGGAGAAGCGLESARL